jgi:hypothetical protein
MEGERKNKGTKKEGKSVKKDTKYEINIEKENRKRSDGGKKRKKRQREI